MELTEARKQFARLQERLSAYNHAVEMISFEGDTTAPRGTADNRTHTLGILKEDLYKLSTGEETIALLDYLDERRKELTLREQRQLDLMLRDIRYAQKIPMDEYVAYERLLVESQAVWHRAKEENDFPAFAPYLEKVFAAKVRFAHYAAPDKDAYDYWLGQHEYGFTQEMLDPFFGLLREKLVPLIRACGEKPSISNACLKGDFPVEAQRRLAEYLMRIMGLNPDRVGLAETEHPFTASLGSHLDVRVTTHYHRDDFSASLFSVMHECGHALYDTGCDDDLAYTALDGGIHMSIHESQSRFYENILGRSAAFIRFLFPKLQEFFPGALDHASWQEVYRAVNRVQPSLIRTKADEVTYSLHVMIRYELEKQLMHGELAVRDLPGAWNQMYKKYLGVDVPDDRRGVLQDSHWSSGLIGYFPAYTMGSAYGAHFLARMREQVDVDAALARGDFSPMNEWNRPHIWRYGFLFTPAQLLESALGEPFDPSYYLDYLERKCLELYGL